MTKPIIICVEGNIGSGKSTMVNYLSQYFTNYINTHNINHNKQYKVAYLIEPVDEWIKYKNSDNNNILELFYIDKDKYSFPFQMVILHSRITQLQNAIDDGYDIIISERSILSSYRVFIKMLIDYNNMNSIEYQIYEKWFNLYENTIRDINIIYIKTSPEICNLRINKRNRQGESGILLSYLKNCHYYHEIWINTQVSKDKLYIINGNIDTKKSMVIGNNYYIDIMNFIYINFILQS